MPIHKHVTYGETFFPVEGELGVVAHNGTKTLTLSKGDSHPIQAGEWHRFFNPSDSKAITFDAKVQPGHQGFEKMLHIFYGLVEDGHGTPEGFPSSLYHHFMLQDMGAVSYPGWKAWFFEQVAKVVGMVARLTGEEERLTQKYYGRPITPDERVKYKIA